MDYPDAVIAKAKRTATLIERVESGESLAKVRTELGLSVSWEQLKKLQAKYEAGGREWQVLLDGRFGHDVKAHSALRAWLYERKRQDPSHQSEYARDIGLLLLLTGFA